jgi:hypothetical protein
MTKTIALNGHGVRRPPQFIKTKKVPENELIVGLLLKPEKRLDDDAFLVA